MNRCGYSLIELVVALISAAVLVSSLAGTVVITRELLEVPPDDQAQGHDREIADRLAADLRYATAISENSSSSFQITRPDPQTAVDQTVTYESSMGGLTRQVDSGPVITFDGEAPSQVFQIDGYSAPTLALSGKVARIRSVSTAASSGSVSSIDVDLPPGCKSGDFLLLCISAKTPGSMSMSETGWKSLTVQNVGDLVQVNVYRSYDPSMVRTRSISVSPDSSIAVAVVAIENADLTLPIDWNDHQSGYAWSFFSASHPSPLETSGFTTGQLNVQVFAADGDPWHAGTLGLASFTDVARATAARADMMISTSIGVVIRNGATPSLSSTPHLWHQSSGYWLQAGIRLGVSP